MEFDIYYYSFQFFCVLRASAQFFPAVTAIEDKTPLGLSGGFDLLQFSPNVSFLHKERPYLEDEGGGEPGDSGGVAGGDEGPVPGTCLVLDGRYGGDAGEVE